MALTSLSMDDEDMPEGTLIPDSELPELPGELCGIWAYIQWEAAGCPNRSQHESDAEYQKAIAVSGSSVAKMVCSQGFDQPVARRQAAPRRARLTQAQITEGLLEC